MVCYPQHCVVAAVFEISLIMPCFGFLSLFTFWRFKTGQCFKCYNALAMQIKLKCTLIYICVTGKGKKLGENLKLENEPQQVSTLCRGDITMHLAMHCSYYLN